jgi:hypothetical protein
MKGSKISWEIVDRVHNELWFYEEHWWSKIHPICLLGDELPVPGWSTGGSPSSQMYGAYFGAEGRKPSTNRPVLTRHVLFNPRFRRLGDDGADGRGCRTNQDDQMIRIRMSLLIAGDGRAADDQRQQSETAKTGDIQMDVVWRSYLCTQGLYLVPTWARTRRSCVRALGFLCHGDLRMSWRDWLRSYRPWQTRWVFDREARPIKQAIQGFDLEHNVIAWVVSTYRPSGLLGSNSSHHQPSSQRIRVRCIARSLPSKDLQKLFSIPNIPFVCDFYTPIQLWIS